MFIDQTVVDDTVVGLTEYISVVSTDFLNMIIIKDFKEQNVEDRLIYARNLRYSLQNYDYSSGYFTDDDRDGTYDAFVNGTTEQKTTLMQDEDGNYFIDTDGDGEWDYIYNLETEDLSEYIPETKGEDYTALIILAVVIILIGCVLFYYLIYNKKPEKIVKKTDKKQPKNKSDKK